MVREPGAAGTADAVASEPTLPASTATDETLPASSATDETLPASDASNAPLPVSAAMGRMRAGTTLGRYRLDALLGEGGMGSVWSAHDPELGRTVAVKVLRAAAASADGEARLRREAQTMAKLAHPNVIHVYDVGVAHETLFVAMEYVADGTLKEWLSREQRSVDAILDVFAQAGRGLAAAHDAGLVHRDVKPTNILVASDGRVLVSDFGLARPQSDTSPDPGPPAAPPFERLTHSGGIVGTPAYMAPEQHEGGAVDARADQFAWCVALWEALYGALPFAGRSLVELALAKQEGTITAPPETTKIPAHVHAALLQGLAASPEKRFESMHALVAAVAPRSRSRRVLALAIGGVAALALGGTALALTRSSVEDPCVVHGDRFAGVWDAGRRASLEAEFKQPDVPASAFAELAVQLDARKREWNAARLDSCVATRVRKSQSSEIMGLRDACLDRRLGDLRAFVDALHGAEPWKLRLAAQSAVSTGLVEPCNDVTKLARQNPLPDELAQRVMIAAVQQTHALARSQIDSGRYREVPADLVARARATGYQPLIAEALYISSATAAALDHPKEAEQLSEEAVLAAEAGGDDALRFDAEVYLVRLVGYQLQRFEDGLKHAERAKALLARLGNDKMRDADLSFSRGQVYWGAGKYAEAKQYVQYAIDRYEALNPKSQRVAAGLHMLAIAQQELGENEASVASERRGIEIMTALRDANHPLIGQMLSTSGGSLRLLGRYDEALTDLRRALSISEAWMGPESSDVADVLFNLATVSLSRDVPAEAIPPLERAVAIYKKVYGPSHSQTAFGLTRLGSAYSKAGRSADAQRALDEALAIYVTTKGANPFDIAEVHTKLAENYTRSGKPQLVRTHALEAIRVVEAADGKTSGDLAKPLLQLGIAERTLGHRDAAKAAFERGLAVAGDNKKTREAIEAELARP